MNEVIEIVWVFARFVLQVYGHTFEQNNDLIRIVVITKDNYDVLDAMYETYEEALDEYKSKPCFNDWTDRNTLNVMFWYGVFDSEEDHEIVFSKEDCEVINSIIRGAELLQ